MERLDSEQVYRFIGKSTKRSTREIAKHFKVRPAQASAAISILRIKGTVERCATPKDATGSSLWQRSASAR